ncbi:MAG: GNAT family N-acetyltransferase [Prosthecobacter sp.]
MSEEDGPALLAVRAATRENPFGLDALAAAGINSESLASGIRAGRLAGWLSETWPAGNVVGFCLANLPEAELWVLAVLPAYERRGIGRELLARTEVLLWAAGHSTAWLWTSSDRCLRSYGFYVAAGWRQEGEDGERLYLRKTRPDAGTDAKA